MTDKLRHAQIPAVFIAERKRVGTLFHQVKEIYDIIREIQRGDSSQRNWTLATLVRAEGSSYRRPGARLLICDDGKRVGSLSAGCLEDEVALRSDAVMRTGEPALMSFDTRRRFGCAGSIDIFIERGNNEFFAYLAAHLNRRRSCIAITNFAGDMRGSRIVSAEVGAVHRTARGRLGQSPLPDAATSLIQEIHPRIRLIIVGDGPDNVPFHSLGDLLGWEIVAVADPNAILVAPQDDWTAVIVKSHNFGRDFIALQKLLPLDMRYVGLIGPRKRRDQLMNELLDVGVAINAGFFAPAGLDLGAETPEEIALSVMAEIQRVFAEGSGESLRERKMSIHRNAESTPITHAISSQSAD